MCHDFLTDTDVKAVARARGFPPEAISSRGVLETLYLSPQGLDDAFAKLNSKEIAALHRLKRHDAPVDVSYFARAYGVSGGRYDTFNQRYQKCFKEVKARLLRRGLLLMAEHRSSNSKSKLGRCRLAFPVEFHDHLPPIISSPRRLDGEGDWRPNVARDKLREDLQPGENVREARVFRIKSGELRIQDRPFDAEALGLWQRRAWRLALPEKSRPVTDDPLAMSPEEAALHILSQLPPDHWASPDQLAEPLQVFCGQGVKVDAREVCQAGWEWGVLAKQSSDENDWYAPAPAAPRPAPQQYLKAERTSGVIVDLKTAPLDVLAQLVSVADAQARQADKLLLTPNFLKMSEASDAALDSEAVQWMFEKAAAFTKMSEKLAERRGKTILHDNLCFAKVSDLSLKVAIEKALGGDVVSLKNEFIAFPQGSLNAVLKVVKKSGHVVKEVAAK